MKTARPKSLRDWAREYLRYWGMKDDAGADQEHELIRVLRAAIAEDRTARDTEHTAYRGTLAPSSEIDTAADRAKLSNPVVESVAPGYPLKLLDEIDRLRSLLADRASRGTGEREAGRREAFAEASNLLRDSVALAKGRLARGDSAELVAAVARRADERLCCADDIDALALAASPIPVPDEVVMREDVVRWLEAMPVAVAMRLGERLRDGSWLSDLRSLDAGKEGT